MRKAPTPYTEANIQPDGRDFFACVHPFGPKGLWFQRVAGTWTIFVDREVFLKTTEANEALDLINRRIAEWVEMQQ